MFREIADSNRVHTIPNYSYSPRRALNYLDKHKRCEIDMVDLRKKQSRLDLMYKTYKNNKVPDSTTRPYGRGVPFSPRFWGTQVVHAEEFSRLIHSSYGVKFFNQKPLEVRRAPFMPTFSSGTVVGPVMFSRWIELGFGTRDIMQIINE